MWRATCRILNEALLTFAFVFSAAMVGTFVFMCLMLAYALLMVLTGHT